MDSLHDHDRAVAGGELARFRGEFYASLTARADALFELTDALLCADGPVTSLVELTLVGEHRRGHGAMYDALAQGRVEPARLRRALASLPIPRAGNGRIALAVDISAWLRPDAQTSPQRLFCHVHGRGNNASQLIPGWPYSFVAALEVGRSSWTAVLDAVRLGPADDPTVVTAAQLRAVLAQLTTAGHWQPTDPPILIVTDAGYDLSRLAFLLADLPVELLGRIRSNRHMRLPAPPATGPRPPGRPRTYRPDIALNNPDTWPEPDHITHTPTPRHGTATALAWDRASPRLTRRGPWKTHPGPLPVLEGTLIHLQTDALPHNHKPTPMWLWSSTPNASPADINRWWQAYLRRFDLEHTFRLFKQTLGWTRPKLRTPDAADRWTWLIITAHTQLRLARPLAADLHRPWEKPAPPHRLTPARVRRSFRHIRATTALPARAPKTSRPGPGRPPGSRNRHRAPHHNVGKHPHANAQPSTTG